MSNSYFQFKQFRIEQGRVAMKVSTDACIQGAWTPMEAEVSRILDIGAGTGLLSLMMAQRNARAEIEAVEIEAASAAGATMNVEASPWRDRIRVIHGDIRRLMSSSEYDLIICNPPFFTSDLLGPDSKRNQARHTLSLSFDELFEAISIRLRPGGYCSILLPVREQERWERLITKNGWCVFHKLYIVPRMGQAANRVVSLCRPEAVLGQEEELVIRYNDNTYSPEFRELMAPFYLHL